jgi:hypothetical protein
MSITEDELELLRAMDKKRKAERSPYFPAEYLKHLKNNRKILRSLRAKGLVFTYKAGRAVGITKLGDEVLAKSGKEAGER